jgi:hypothetical protein
MTAFGNLPEWQQLAVKRLRLDGRFTTQNGHSAISIPAVRPAPMSRSMVPNCISSELTAAEELNPSLRRRIDARLCLVQHNLPAIPTSKEVQCGPNLSNVASDFWLQP